MSRFTTTCLAAALAVALGAGQGLPRLKPGFNLYSKQQDVELGREAARQVATKYQEVRDPELSGYLSRLGARLTSQPQADGGAFPYTFTLVRDKTVNAFALPGGPTFVQTGLLLAAENEAQLAGVLAHEISHVALRHGTHQATKSMGIQLAAGLLGAGVGGGSMLGQLTQAGIAFGANSVLLKHSRDAERQADLLGAEIVAGAGYNPIEMARFFEKLEAEGGARGPQFLSDHPNPGNRVRYIEEEIRLLPRSQFNGDTGQFRRMQDRVRKLAGGAASN
jgi:beta-barrel assembly-enhancing protease